MSSSLSKILEAGINVFKSNYQIIKNKKYYEILTIYERVEKLSMNIGLKKSYPSQIGFLLNII